MFSVRTDARPNATVLALIATIGSTVAGCASQPAKENVLRDTPGGARVRAQELPPGMSMGSGGETMVPTQVITQAEAAQMTGLAVQQLTLAAGVFNTLLDPANRSTLEPYRNQFATQRVMLEALRIRADALNERMTGIAKDPNAFDKRMETDVRVVAAAGQAAEGLARLSLQRYLPNLSLQQFVGAKVTAIATLNRVEDGLSVPETLAAAEAAGRRLDWYNHRTIELSTGIDRQLRDADHTLYAAATRVVNFDRLAWTDQSDHINQKYLLGALRLRDGFEAELQRLLEQNDREILLTMVADLSPQAWATVVGTSDSDKTAYAKFSGYMQEKFPTRWRMIGTNDDGNFAQGFQVAFWLAVRTREAATFRGTNNLENGASNALSAEQEMIFSEAWKRFATSAYLPNGQ